MPAIRRGADRGASAAAHRAESKRHRDPVTGAEIAELPLRDQRVVAPTGLLVRPGDPSLTAATAPPVAASAQGRIDEAAAAVAAVDHAFTAGDDDQPANRRRGR